MAKRERSPSLFEPRSYVSWRRVPRNSDEGIWFKPYVEQAFSLGEIRDQVLALIGCCAPGPGFAFFLSRKMMTAFASTSDMSGQILNLAYKNVDW
jgi:hypothetical protein